MGYCFPHYFVLPMYSSASSYRFRPLGPEETLMEIWSLDALPGGRASRRSRRRPSRGSATIRGGRRSRRRTSRTCRASRRACTRRASSTCACPSGLEGHISNFERTIDGFLAGLPYEKLLPALQCDQREPARAADRRPRLLSGVTRARHTPMSSRASAPRSPRTRTRSTTAAPTTSSPPSAPTAWCDIPGMGTHEGHDALRAAYARVEAAAAPAPSRRQHARHRLERRRGQRDRAT